MGTKQTHGGARKGAGRKPHGAAPMVRRNLMLDDATVEGARIIGGGNASEGVRIAVADTMKRGKYTK